MSTIKTNTIQPTLAGNNLIFANGSAAEKMRITNEGLVGIGTDPSTILHIKSAGETLRLETTSALGGNYMSFFSPGGVLRGYIGRVSTTDNHFVVENATANDLILSTNNAEKMRILSTGNVGIGTTTPVAKLQIVGEAGQSEALRLTVGTTGDIGLRVYEDVDSIGFLRLRPLTSTQKGFMFSDNGDTSILSIDTLSYRVSIGTASVPCVLDVVGAGKFSQSVTIGGATFNAPSGTAPIFGARALVVFDTNKNSAGTTETTLTLTNRFIRHDGNIASVNRTAVGIYIITFTTPMPHANYVVICDIANNLQNSSLVASLSAGTTTTANTYQNALLPLQPFNKTTTSFTIHTGSSASGNRIDPLANPISVLVFA